jgi:hypothetical protein
MEQPSPEDPGPTLAERLVLVSEFQRNGHHFVLDKPVYIQAGERYWVDGEALAIERLSGEVERHRRVRVCR